MTVTALEAATSTATNNDNGTFLPSNQGSRQCWTCNTCLVSFESGAAQRIHMKSPWHVYNLKRRITSLDPISLSIFTHQVQTRPEPLERTSRQVAARKEVEEAEEFTSSRQCLFCHLRFDDTDDFGNVLEHMSTVHGLFIPERDRISDLESFLGYLATVVRVWHECLYCGSARNSTLAIQSHMRDLAHCKLNFDREPELLGFWEEEGSVFGSVRRARLCDKTTTKTSTWSRQRRIKASRVTNRQLLLTAGTAEAPPPTLHQEQSCRLISRRDEAGIRNIGQQQRHALFLAERRSQRVEGGASGASEWSYAKTANKQKHDQAHGPLSWAKGGLHQLLPR